MRPWRLTLCLLTVWTLAMAAWFGLYQAAAATCGPEIYRNCQIGLKVTGGLGRPGIVLLWSLVVVVLGVTWLTRPTPAVQRQEKPARRALPGRPRSAMRPTASIAALSAAALTMALAIVLIATRSADSPRIPTPIEPVRVRVVSTILHPAATPAGRRRGAARVGVHLRVTNPRGNRPLTLEQTVLLSGGEALTYDPAQIVAARSLLRPLAPGATADGTLRFEPRGEFTERLTTELRASLRIADRTVPLTLKIGRPVT